MAPHLFVVPEQQDNVSRTPVVDTLKITDRRRDIMRRDALLETLAESRGRALVGYAYLFTGELRDPVTTLAVFRRRRRTRAAVSTVAAVAAVAGLGLGVSLLNPPEVDILPASPAPTTSPAPSPESPSPSSGETPLHAACGLDTGAAFAVLSGIPVDSHAPLGTTGIDVYADVDTEAFDTAGMLHVTSFAASAVEPPAGTTAPHEYRAWFLVSDVAGRVAGVAEPWSLTDKQESDRETPVTLCPGASWAELAGTEEFTTQIAVAPVDGASSATPK